MPFAERAGRRIHYTRIGEGPTVLLVPGIGTGARLFGTLPRRFARAGFCAAAIDPVGLPPSGPRTGPYSLREAGLDLAAVAGELPAPVALAGTSLGGKVALEAAAAAPECCAALVLLASSPVATRRAQAVYRWFEVLAEHIDDRDFGTALAPFLFGSTFHERHPRTVVELLAALRPDPLARALMLEQARALQHFDGRSLAPRVETPVLLLAGAEDTLTPPAEVAAGAAGFRQVRFEVIAGAGHSLLLESPAVFDRIVAFLRQPRARG